MKNVLTNPRGWFVCSIAILLIFGESLWAAKEKKNNAETAMPAQGEIYTVTNKASYSQIRNLNDNQDVKLKSGRVVKAGRLKALAEIVRSANKAPSTSKSPTGFSKNTAAGKVHIEKGFNLRKLETMSSGETLQLPSGRSITVSDFKKIDQVYKATHSGRSLLDGQPALPNHKGAAIKVKSLKELQALSDKPDNTIVENQLGKRITLGELRSYAKKVNKPFGVRK